MRPTNLNLFPRWADAIDSTNVTKNEIGTMTIAPRPVTVAERVNALAEPLLSFDAKMPAVEPSSIVQLPA